MTGRSFEERVASLPRSRIWLFRLISMLIGLIAALVCIETVLRWKVPISDVNLFLFQPGAQRHRIMRPHARGTIYGVPIEINGQGFRDRREYGPDKPAGTIRVAVMGDSYTVGSGVEFERIFTEQLEARLEASSRGRPVEVFNFALGGIGLLHHAAMLEEVILSYSPDLILLNLFPYNDIDVDTYDREERYLAEHADGADPVPLPGGRLWWQHARITQLLAAQVPAALRQIPLARSLVPVPIFEKIVHRYRDRTIHRQRGAAALRRINDLAAGIPVQVFLMPLTGRTWEEQSELHTLCGEMVREAGLPSFSLHEGFEATGRAPHDFALNLIDAHPDAAYHALAAELAHHALQESGLLDRILEGADAVPSS